MFESCDQQEGLAVWRLIVPNHVAKTPQEQLDLQSLALKPKRCERHRHIENAIVAWQRDVRRFHDTLPRDYPERLSEARQVNALLRLLPTDIQIKAF